MTREHEGSGIGLALTKSLVELLGGSLRLSSAAGEGSKFIVELPIKQSIHPGAITVIRNSNLDENIAIALSDISDIALTS